MKREKLTVKASDVRSIKMSVTEGRASRSDYYKIPEVVNE